MNRTKRLNVILVAGLMMVSFLGNAAFRGREATHLSPASIVQTASPTPTPVPTSLSCVGKERWTIKTGTDAGARNVTLTPVKSNVASLVGLSKPPSLPEDTRISPTENTVYTISAMLTGYIKEDDQDYHLTLQDGNNQMIAEIPNPKCAMGSLFLDKISSARANFEKQFRIDPNISTGTFHSIDSGIPVQITGIGFFDKIHGQRGVAPNGIELHPVLEIDFNPTNPASAVTSALPPISEVSNIKWEYSMFAAQSAEALVDELNQRGDEGWELVNVIFDTKRTEPYVAFLKRQKD